MGDDVKLERMHGLRRWMYSLGCCVWCSLGMAIATVDQEHGESFDWRAKWGPCKGSRDVLGIRRSCEDLARAAWPKRPRKKLGTPGGPVARDGAARGIADAQASKPPQGQKAGDVRVTPARTNHATSTSENGNHSIPPSIGGGAPASSELEKSSSRWTGRSSGATQT